MVGHGVGSSPAAAPRSVSLHVGHHARQIKCRRRLIRCRSCCRVAQQEVPRRYLSSGCGHLRLVFAGCAMALTWHGAAELSPTHQAWSGSCINSPSARLVCQPGCAAWVESGSGDPCSILRCIRVSRAHRESDKVHTCSTFLTLSPNIGCFSAKSRPPLACPVVVVCRCGRRDNTDHPPSTLRLRTFPLASFCGLL